MLNPRVQVHVRGKTKYSNVKLNLSKGWQRTMGFHPLGYRSTTSRLTFELENSSSPLLTGDATFDTDSKLLKDTRRRRKRRTFA